MWSRLKEAGQFGVRVSQGGAKAFVLVHGTNRQFTTIGRQGITTLREARGEAKRLLAEITLGKIRSISVSFDDARDRFLDACRAKNKPRTVYDYERLPNRHFKLDRIPIQNSTQHELMRRVGKLANTPGAQNHAFVRTNVFFAWAVLICGDVYRPYELPA